MTTSTHALPFHPLRIGMYKNFEAFGRTHGIISDGLVHDRLGSSYFQSNISLLLNFICSSVAVAHSSSLQVRHTR